MRPLDVGVNLTWLAPGRVGGSEQYLERQLSGLPVDRVDVTLYCQPSLTAAYPTLAERFRIVESPSQRDSRATRIALEHTWLARRTRGHDLVHHGGGTVPLVGAPTTVLTIHDLQYRVFPDYFSAMRRRYLEMMMPRSAKRATMIATPTEYVRGTVLDAFDIDADRVVVVPHGVPAIDQPSASAIADVARRYGLRDRRYVVYPAITHQHKGHRVLLDMLAKRRDDLVVAFVGGEGDAEGALRARVESDDLGDRVVRTGRVAPTDRDALIAGASALVFPSEYEGFGAPLVEAMALGVPVVCSAAEAVCEVVGEAAIVVRDDDWAAAVDQAIERRDELVAAGRQRREAFTLHVSGAALLRVYEAAAS